MKKVLRFGFYCLYYPIARLFLKLERIVSWKENRIWIDNTPNGVFQGIAFESYTNWIFHQGFFSALLGQYFDRSDLKVLDFGCGMGKYAPVFQFFTKNGGHYLGIDTDIQVIEQCKNTFHSLKNCEFYLTNDQNAFYKNPGVEKQREAQADWPVKNGTQDVLLSISVFTHLQEKESRLYFNKVFDVLVKGGIAIISFHVVRDYVNSNPFFNFTTKLTPGWYTSNPDCPENAIAVDAETIRSLVKNRFEILNWWEGSSTGGKSSFFQDLLVLKKI